jgi:8-oxo-dGTP pyrophosphatase MutT (NUDIX family)
MIDKLKHMLIGLQPGLEDIYKITSVFIPLVEINGKINLLFELRSKNLNSQPGEICFPGGKVENDEIPLLSAIRETVEEIGINEEKLEILGELDTVITPFNLVIHPFVGCLKINSLDDLKINKNEVEECFMIPLDYFIKTIPTKYLTETKMVLPMDFPFDLIPQGEEYKFKRGSYDVLFYEFENKVIWGLTAKIIKNLVKIIGDRS